MADLAQLNIIPDIYADVRFKALARLMKSERMAMGCLIEAFFLGQKYWRRGKSLIPLEIWDLSNLNEIVESHLAERTENGVYVKGAEKYFTWIHDLDEKRSMAGKKSAEARKEKYGTAQPQHSRTHLEQTRTPTEQDLEHHRTPSKAITITSTNLNTDKSTSVDQPPPETKKTKPKANCLLFDLWNTHCGNLPKARGMSTKRLSVANARLKENASEEYWVGVIKRLSSSSFCLGDNDRGWKADFDFLLKPDTHLKCLEGKYDGKKSKVCDKEPVKRLTTAESRVYIP